MNAHSETKSAVPALMVGGSVNAIIPQSVEEMWRVSKMVVAAGLAPQALTAKKTPEEAASSVAVAIMAGAELGLPPMVALRSFTVIGGKPALYGDGIINVARRSRKAAYIRTGYDADKQCGWCEAKRSDTGEEKRVEFSVEDAKRASLWDERQTVRRKKYNSNEYYDAPNDAPWFRYPQRMLAWRAAGYCLRELFADVLGGITDEFEAREIAGEDDRPMRDVTPPSPPSATPPSPPSAAKQHVIDVEDDNAAETNGFDLGAYLTDLEEAINLQNDEESVAEIWNEMDPEATLETEGHADMIETAFNIRNRRLAVLSPVGAG